MSKKTLAARRQQLQAISQQEAKARCAYANCRQPLPKMHQHMGLRYCDDGCQIAEEAWAQAREARR